MFSNFFCRFGQEPFLVEYEVKRTVAGAQVFIRPDLLTPVAYLDPFVKAGVFFNRLEVTLDGIRIEAPVVEDSFAHFQHLNRLFCSDRVRRELYGDRIQWMSNSHDKSYVQEQVAAQLGQPLFTYTAAVARSINPNLKACMKPLLFAAADVSEPAVCFFGHDGSFPFNTQCNAMRIISGQKNSNAFLHPGLSASFVLVKTTPTITAGIERADVNDTEFFDFATAITAPLNPLLTLTIKSVSLIYESLILDDVAEIRKIHDAKLRYYCDMPIHRLMTLAVGTTHDHQKITLPAMTKLVFLFFVVESQYRPQSKANSFFSSRFKFPPFLDEIHLSLMGKEDLIFARGFRGMGSTKCRNSQSARLFVNELIKKGLYSKTFDDFFPPTDATIHGYDQALVLDFFPYASALKEVSTLEVDLTYSDASVANWKLKAICMVQIIHEYTKKEKWTFQYV
jgi:hypothetical protein